MSDVSDVVEVLDWARTQARSGQTFVIYVEQRDDRRSGLVRLFGADPTSVA